MIKIYCKSVEKGHFKVSREGMNFSPKCYYAFDWLFRGNKSTTSFPQQSLPQN